MVPPISPVPGGTSGVRFKCIRCGRCCRWLEVPVVFSDVRLWLESGRTDILRNVCITSGVLARRLGLDKYFALRRSHGGCVFFRAGLCSIYEYRPLACRLFPFAIGEPGLAIHPWAEENCPGLGVGRPLSGEEESRLAELASAILRELLDLPQYCVFLEELLRKLQWK